MLELFLIIIFSFFLVNCEINNKGSYKKFNQFSFKLPNNWKLVNSDGIDSKIAYLITEDKDTIHLEYGMYNEEIRHNLFKILPTESKNKFNDEELKGGIIRFSKTPYLDQALGIFLKEYITMIH